MAENQFHDNKAVIGQSLIIILSVYNIRVLCNNAEFIVALSYVKNCNEMHVIAVDRQYLEEGGDWVIVSVFRLHIILLSIFYTHDNS